MENELMEDQTENPEMRVVPALPEKFVEGRDELNFAEFPLGTISERTDANTKTLIFEDKIFDKSRNQLITRRLTITGSDAFGLPTSTDDEVLLGLIQLSKLQKFEDRRVFFSRYQLLKLLRWPISGQSYARIDQALNRWIGVTLYYQNAWRDKSTNAWVDEKFHILERVKIYSLENESSRPKPSPQQGSFEFAASFFVWNDALFKSFSHGNLKALNYDFVLGLKSSISRRLYRFLDKRFFHSRTLEFELKNLAYEHIGLSRKTPVGDLKRKLGVAMDELVTKKFLKDLPKERRFTKVRAGHWRVAFERMPEGQGSGMGGDLPLIELKVEAPELSPVEQKLVGLGVTQERARKLASAHSHELIQEKIDVLEFLVSTGDPKVATNPAGFLVRSIEQRFEPPRNFVPPGVLKEKEVAKTKRAEERLTKEKRRQDREEARERDWQAAIDGYWQGLTPEGRARAEEAALKGAEHFQQDLISRGGALGKAARQSVLNNHALSQLANG
ncbi:MAG: replication initiator protein A [Planctomycetota bacterium]|nr:MAG: replication initiator protein A [Planctomycetota bacterium]